MKRILIITVVGLGLILAGCSSTSKKTAPTTNPPRTTSTATSSTTSPSTTSATTAPSTTAPTNTTTPVTPTTVARPGACAFSQLKVTAGNDSAAGHIGVILRFQNTSALTCNITGYPGVAGLNAAGQQVAQAKRTPNGSIPGIPTGTKPPLVTLRAGQSASNFVEGSDVPQGGATGACPEYPKLLVTPPNTTQQVTINMEMPGCNFQVHPVVAGTSGTNSV